MSTAPFSSSGNGSMSRKRMKLENNAVEAGEETKETDKNDTAINSSDDHKAPPCVEDKDKHVHVLLKLEYHGTNYGGWQRQGPNNKIVFPSVQGTLEEAATKACHFFVTADIVAIEPQISMIATTENGDKRAVMAGNSGRTDRAVHAREHFCLLRLPFRKFDLYQAGEGGEEEGLFHYLMGSRLTLAQPSMQTKNGTTTKIMPSISMSAVNESPFLAQINSNLPSDIYVLTCRVLSQQERKNLHFCRKRYEYIIQQAPPQPQSTSSSSEASANTNRPWPAWNDYTYFVKQKLDPSLMEKALQYMVGRHDFLPLSCQKDKVHTIRTIYTAKITVLEHPFDDLPWFRHAYRSDTTTAATKKKKKKQQQKAATPTTTTSASTAGGIADADPLPCRRQDNNNTSVSIFSPPQYGQAAHYVPALHAKNNHLRPQDYRLYKIEFEGNGFLKNQVRRMVSVLQKVGEGVWPPECVLEILNEKKDNEKKNNNDNHAFLKGRALSPGRGLWKAKVWMGDDRESTATVTRSIDGDDDDE